MPDVSISNTIVQEDLAENESVTVPSGESWDVTIFADGSGFEVKINGSDIANSTETGDRTQFSTVLHGGDTTKSSKKGTRIRGWVVREP